MLLVVSACGVALLVLLVLEWIDPPATAVHIQGRFESWFSGPRYEKRFRFFPLARISPHRQHAVVAAEDTRSYKHRGFDWEEIKDALYDDLDEGRVRGASTISQQLVKNLFLTTRGSILRKAAEFAIVPAADWVLGIQRILELYLDVIEWGSGVYGAAAAARYHCGVPALRLGRGQSARRAAVLPSPRRRKPARMNKMSAVILARMSQMGW